MNNKNKKVKVEYNFSDDEEEELNQDDIEVSGEMLDKILSLDKDISGKTNNYSKRALTTNPLSFIRSDHDHSLVKIGKIAQNIASGRLIDSKLGAINESLKRELTSDLFFSSFDTFLSIMESEFKSESNNDLLKNISDFETKNQTKCKGMMFLHEKKEVFCEFILDNKGVFFLIICYKYNINLEPYVPSEDILTWNSSLVKSDDWMKIYKTQVNYIGHSYINCSCIEKEIK